MRIIDIIAIVFSCVSFIYIGWIFHIAYTHLKIIINDARQREKRKDSIIRMVEHGEKMDLYSDVFSEEEIQEAINEVRGLRSK